MPWALGLQFPTPMPRTAGKCYASGPHWCENVSLFPSSICFCVSRAHSAQRAPHWHPPPSGRLSRVNTASAVEHVSRPCPSPHPACFLLHFCSFYSFAQICLCVKFTARTACLNYLKAQYSRLCRKAFPFCVFYFSV